MRIFSVTTIVSGLCLLSLLPAAALAFGGPPDNDRPRPPQAAFDICQGKQAGECVEFTNRQGQAVRATCTAVGDTLVAIPEDGRFGKQHNGKFAATGKPGRHAAGEPGSFGPRMAALLQLSAEQQTQIQALHDRMRQQNEPLRAQLRQQRLAVMSAMHAQPLDEEALRSAIAVQNSVRSELMINRARNHQQVLALLSPEQQQRAQQHFENNFKNRQSDAQEPDME